MKTTGSGIEFSCPLVLFFNHDTGRKYGFSSGVGMLVMKSF